MSAPDDRVSGCCFYAGATDPWRQAADVPPRSFEDLWNSPRLQEMRALQHVARPPADNGCANCHLLANRPNGHVDMYDLGDGSKPADLSPRQEANWRLAQEEYRAGVTQVSCRPVRVYANFGFACNISCTMCHQVPRRLDNRHTVSADQLMAWGDDIAVASQMAVIGGEPFVLPQAIKFMRAFTADPRFDDVLLILGTNGTILHKHWETLYRKRKLAVTVSLDGIGAAFESIRLGTDWPSVERNVLRLVETRDRDRPGWQVKTATQMMKSNLRNLPEFARWHTRHGVSALFTDFISAAGVEDTFHRENYLHHPQLLADIPDWRDYLDAAAAEFARAGQTAEAANLTHFRRRVEEQVQRSATRIEHGRRQLRRNDWAALVSETGAPAAGEAEASTDWAGRLEANPASGLGPVPLGMAQGVPAILRTRLGDHLATPFIDIRPGAGAAFRVKLVWPKVEMTDKFERPAHVAVQQQDCQELPAYRETIEFGPGSELVLTGELPADTQRLRVVLTPVGEEVSLLPRRLEIDLDPGTVRLPPRRPSGLQRLLGLFARKPAERAA